MIELKLTTIDARQLLNWIRSQTNVPYEVMEVASDLSEELAEYDDLSREKIRIEYESELMGDE